jgi:hypothetical protein
VRCVLGRALDVPQAAVRSGRGRSPVVGPVGRRAAARTADGWAGEAFQARDRRATSGHERPDRSGQQQSPSIDLGTLRLDAAIMFGPPAAAAVLVGWRRATGRAADAMAYWDLVAALTTPPDMTQWLSVAHDHGRVDLDAATLTTGATRSCAPRSTSSDAINSTPKPLRGPQVLCMATATFTPPDQQREGQRRRKTRTHQENSQPASKARTSRSRGRCWSSASSSRTVVHSP